MSDLSADDLTDLRQNWLRDQWIDPPTSTGISRYNMANKKNFFTDTQIKAIDDRVVNDRAEELAALRTEKWLERVNLGGDDATAGLTADAAKKYARFRLIRADCREVMMESPDFAASFVVGGDNKAADLFDAWKEGNTRDRTFVRSRSGGFASIEVERG